MVFLVPLTVFWANLVAPMIGDFLLSRQRFACHMASNLYQREVLFFDDNDDDGGAA